MAKTLQQVELNSTTTWVILVTDKKFLKLVKEFESSNDAIQYLGIDRPWGFGTDIYDHYQDVAQHLKTYHSNQIKSVTTTYGVGEGVMFGVMHGELPHVTTKEGKSLLGVSAVKIEKHVASSV